LPVAIGIIGGRGTDAPFTSFIKEILEAAKIPKTVDVGRTAFKLEEVETNSAVDDGTWGLPVHEDSQYAFRSGKF
jgi:hypothetical protein